VHYKKWIYDAKPIETDSYPHTFCVEVQMVADLIEGTIKTLHLHLYLQ